MPSINRQKPTPLNQPKRGGSILERIRPIGFDDDDGIKLLLYGKSGTGKTTCWGTFPSPILSIICSGSDKPGELRSIDTPENRKRIQQVVLEKPMELKILCDNIKSHPTSYKTVVLDHATGFQDLVLKEILNLDELPAQNSWGMAKQQEWGQCAMQCKELLRGLLSLPCNVVIVSQEREHRGGDNDSELLTPNIGAGLIPSLAGWVYTAVEYICQTYIRQRMERVVTTLGQGKMAKEIEQLVAVKGKVEYCLRTAPDPIYTTKFRVPKGTPLPDVIIDPDYDKIMALIRGEHQE